MTSVERIHVGTDGVARCSWCGDDEAYVAYHDDEWGRPVRDDTRLFEKLCLEGFQAGLSWITVLRKRENFRRGFAGFSPPVVAAFTTRDVERLLVDPGIIRHRGKIEAVVNNARRCGEMFPRSGELTSYLWSFAPSSPEHDGHRTGTLPASTPASTRLSKDLRKNGWKFVGPTTMYAFMQSMGFVNDHFDGCVIRAQCG